LCGDRGIPALHHLCDDIKFKGKGHEASDLKLLVQRYEYWAHRLFPKFPFADVVDQVENLGHKKLVQNCLKRIRRGEDDTVEDGDRSDSELPQNIESQDGGSLSQVPATPVMNNNQTFGVQMETRDRMVILTPEQQERIRLNRERALAKRRAAQEKQAEQNNTQTDDQTRTTEGTVPSTDDVGIAKDDDDDTWARNLAELKSCSPTQANDDIEMEDDNVNRNIQLPNDDGKETINSAETNAKEESVEQEDIEMANVETFALDNTTDIIPQNKNVPETEQRDTNGTTENDLLGPVKDLPPNEDNEDLVTVPLLQDTPSSLYNDEALHQEGPQETLVEVPTKNAPGESEPGETQNAEMETEQ